MAPHISDVSPPHALLHLVLPKGGGIKNRIVPWFQSITRLEGAPIKDQYCSSSLVIISVKRGKIGRDFR
jgi:hypothetical protein